MPGDTKYKVSEAEFFLEMIKCNRDYYIRQDGQDESTFNRFKYFISAFLSSARSILDYQKDEYTLKDNLYYNTVVYGYDYLKKIGTGDKNRKKLRDEFISLPPAADKEIQELSAHFGELRYFNVLRTDQVHRASKCWYSVPHDPVKRVECTYSHDVIIVKDGLPTPEPPVYVFRPSTTRVEQVIFMREPHYLKADTEIVEFCRRNLNVIKQMVALCEKGNFDASNLMKIPTEATD